LAIQGRGPLVKEDDVSPDGFSQDDRRSLASLKLLQVRATLLIEKPYTELVLVTGATLQDL
jgi:hypothetical protein